MRHNEKRGVVPSGTLPSIFRALSIGACVSKIGPVVFDLLGLNRKMGGSWYKSGKCTWIA